MNSPSLTGGCLCGTARYHLTAAPLQTTVCHCADCRRASGAPFVVWTFFQTGTLVWETAPPKRLHFADRDRTFCADCGTPLTFFDPAIPHLFEVNTSTFDDPIPFAPLDQCWLDDQLPWTPKIPTLPGTPETGPLPALPSLSE